MLKPRLTVKEAAELMGINPQSLRIAIQKGKFPFGFGVETSSQYTYWISTFDVLKHLGYAVELMAVPDFLKEKAPEELAGSTSANNK